MITFYIDIAKMMCYSNGKGNQTIKFSTEAKE